LSGSVKKEWAGKSMFRERILAVATGTSFGMRIAQEITGGQ
jgi:hypothetical protein